MIGFWLEKSRSNSSYSERLSLTLSLSLFIREAISEFLGIILFDLSDYSYGLDTNDI